VLIHQPQLNTLLLLAVAVRLRAPVALVVIEQQQVLQ
jgi:hypothetical protein